MPWWGWLLVFAAILVGRFWGGIAATVLAAVLAGLVFVPAAAAPGTPSIVPTLLFGLLFLVPPLLRLLGE